MALPTPPTGTVTFLFTDIEGSTKLAQKYPGQWEALRQRHHAILHKSIQAHDGTIFQDIGDGLCAAFHTAPQALEAAVQAQLALQQEVWEPVPVKVRMGIHTGAAQLNNDGLRTDYLGYTTLALTSRIMSAGHGGQILLSGATRELVRDFLPANTEMIDLGEKRLKDLLRPEHLSQLTPAGLPKIFPPIKTLEAFPNNLPMQLTTFVGREKEIGEVKAELETHRLVTLTGSGGTGKTRLSLQVAADLLENFEQGVWFVELAPLADPALIPQTIQAAIGITEQPGKMPLDILKEYLVDKQTLIVLDNCEHLIEDSSKVADALLHAAPGLKVLASSREALGVRGELSYPVPSLSLPDPKHMPEMEALSQYEAVRLFIDRALLVSPHFTVDKDNAPFIAQVCYRLDGIPLAIELAAARIKMMSLEQISARLDDRFRLLTGGARTALPRQQTLRALIDWSYDILTDTERLLTRRLSVFAGGWTLETAEEVCSGEGIQSYEVMDLLGQLLNKSLVSVIECSDCGVMRYRMLETIRQYAREKLLEAGGSESIYRRHLAYFSKLAEQAGPELTRSDQVKWLDQLEDELDNLRKALEWALASDVPAGLRLLVASAPFWEARVHPRELSDWLGELLERYPAEDVLRTRALALRAWWLALQDDFSQARTLLDQSLQLSRRISDRQDEAYSLLGLGVLTTTQGNHASGIPIVEQSLAIYEELGDMLGQANANGWLTLNHNDLERSKALAAKSLQLNRQMGHLAGIAGSLGELARRMIWGGDMVTPLPLMDEARRLFHDLRDPAGEAEILQIYGTLAYWQGNYASSYASYKESAELADRSGTVLFIHWSRIGMAYALFRQGNLEQARELFIFCVINYQKVGDIIAVVFTLEGLAALDLTTGRLPRAVQLFAWADVMRIKVGDHRPPVEQVAVDKDQAVLRSQLDEKTYAMLSAQGQALTFDQAVALALED
jgi:predicted ATPase/class 3 adenylate cyclase